MQQWSITTFNHCKIKASTQSWYFKSPKQQLLDHLTCCKTTSKEPLFLFLGLPKHIYLPSSLSLSPPLVYAAQPVSPGPLWRKHSGFDACWGVPPPPGGGWPSAPPALVVYLLQIGSEPGWTPAASLQNLDASPPPGKNHETRSIPSEAFVWHCQPAKPN